VGQPLRGQCISDPGSLRAKPSADRGGLIDM
jgi:hypothetical protein